MNLAKVGLAAIVGAACAGCAKFPTNGAGDQFTRVTFRIKVAGKINTTQDEDGTTYYVYDIAIRATDDLNPQDILAPVPVLNENNPNGRVAGSPTHFVEFDSLNPSSAEPFVLNRFATQAEVPNPNDPTNPINLATYGRSTRGRIINYQTLQDDPSVLQFDIYVNLLADDDAKAKLLNTLQVNFLTMTRPSNGIGGKRIIDSIGDGRAPGGTEFARYIKVDLRQDGLISNTTGVTQNIEPADDLWPNGEVEPDLDIIDWSIEVHRAG